MGWKGLSQKLKGNQIPLCARIVAIADASDAMTSSRAYRSALSPEEAYRRIIEGSGTQFDPSMVEIFKRYFLCGKNGPQFFSLKHMSEIDSYFRYDEYEK